MDTLQETTKPETEETENIPTNENESCGLLEDAAQDTKDRQLENNCTVEKDKPLNELEAENSDVVPVTQSSESIDEKETVNENEPATKPMQEETQILKEVSSVPKELPTTEIEEKTIEIEDPDDYLLYLESILTSIYNRFYSIYDETKEIPDLKIIVPKIRSEVLKSCNLVFSGLVPTNMKLQHSRAYFIAKSLGANVYQSITDGKIVYSLFYKKISKKSTF